MRYVEVNRDHLKAALLFAAKNDIRHYLNGVLVERKGGALYVVATDGHTMLACHQDKPKVGGPEDDAGEDFQVIIPRESVDIALRAWSHPCLAIHAPVAVPEPIPGADKWSIAGIPFTPIDGKFPDWRRVIPSKLSGEAAQFDPEYYARCGKAKAIYSKRGKLFLQQNGQAAAVAVLTEDAVAVVMPMRGDAVDLPAWVQS